MRRGNRGSTPRRASTPRGGTSDITFVVKPKLAQRSQVALLANTNTWLAYDGWGGASKYSGLAQISLMRPMVNAAPTTPFPFDMHLTRGELWIQGWLESAGYRPDMYTDLDFHENGCDAAQYRILVCGTHPEYWTPEMYDNLVAYLDDGGSFAYLGGNGLFEDVCLRRASPRDGLPRRRRRRLPRARALAGASTAASRARRDRCRHRTLCGDRLAIRSGRCRPHPLRWHGRGQRRQIRHRRV